MKSSVTGYKEICDTLIRSTEGYKYVLLLLGVGVGVGVGHGVGVGSTNSITDKMLIISINFYPLLLFQFMVVVTTRV